MDEVDAIRMVALCIVVSSITLISGIATAGEAEHVLQWFDYYSDDTDQEALIDDNDGFDTLDTRGTAAGTDI